VPLDGGKKEISKACMKNNSRLLIYNPGKLRFSLSFLLILTPELSKLTPTQVSWKKNPHGT